jgi:sigma-B regulation protein RsbU (phosphoserine phosphatase)
MLSKLRSLSRVEKLFLSFLLLYGVTFFLWPGAAGFFGFFTFVFGGILAFRYIRRGMERVIWRVRNRLLVTYLFIAVVPMAFLVAFVGMGLWLLIGQIAVHTVYNEYRHRSSAPDGSFLMPSATLLADLAPNLGEVVLMDAQNGIVIDLAGDQRQRGLPRASRLPAAVSRLDIEVAGFTPLNINSRTYLLAIFTRPSAVFRTIFGISVEGQQIYQYLFLAIGGAFLTFLLISVVIGVRITQTITSAVHNLYEGTERVKEGDLSYRIPVKGKDQLAELGNSFNRMTQNLERLLEVEKEKERLHSELEIARHVQSGLFPKTAPHMKSLMLSGICRPARMVSGDYYDYLLVDEKHLAVAIGDVAGKGISAALLMASMQSVMRSQLMETRLVSPRHLVGLLNRQLYANTTPEKYATFCFGLYDEQTGSFTYTNAGHLQPLLIRGGSTVHLDVTGTVVGAFPAIPYEEKQIELVGGDLLVAYTDGITEPENAYGEMFGEDRLVEVLMRHQNAEPEEIISRTMEAVREWSSSPEQEDDMTMIVARRLVPGTNGAPVSRS